MSSYPEGVMEDYCPKCERITSHREVQDDVYFDFAFECLNCGIVWEYEEPPIQRVEIAIDEKD